MGFSILTLDVPAGFRGMVGGWLIGFDIRVIEEGSSPRC